MRKLLTLFMMFAATLAGGENAPTVVVCGDSGSAG
jgi:hypothetical protein